MTEPAAPGKPSRFVVGIDLGTTNCALAWVDRGAGCPGRRSAHPHLRDSAVDGVGQRRGPLLAAFLPVPDGGG
jgi:molecular chaperone DnaK (HSP70)